MDMLTATPTNTVKPIKTMFAMKATNALTDPGPFDGCVMVRDGCLP
jgi:hypothetical protein